MLPEIVSQVDYLEGHASSNGSKPQNGKKGKKSDKKGAPLKTWAANPKLFPCDVSPEAQKLTDEVGAAPDRAISCPSSAVLVAALVCQC